jgi:hypothetical protein
MRYNCSLIFEIPNQWLADAHINHFNAKEKSYSSSSEHILIPLADILPPTRNNGVAWFDRTRMTDILSRISNGYELPPIEVRESINIPHYKYIVYDGFHRLYASVAVGFHCVPVKI